MSVPPNEYLNLLQGMNQPMPERNFTPGPGMGPVAMPQPVQEVYLDEFPQPVVPQVQAPIQPMQAPMQAPSPFSYGGMEESLLRSAGLQTQAGRGLMQAQQQAAAQEQRIYQAQQQMLAEQESRVKQEQADYDQKVAPAIERLQALGNEIQGAKYEGFWAKASTPQKIGGALAVGLGALGAGLTGGQNTAMQIINKAIDDDYRNWQANIDAKNKSFLNQRQYINDLQGQFKDKRELALAQKALAYDRANAQLMEIASKRKGLEALPQFQALQANILDNRNKQYLELAKLKAETAKAEREASAEQLPKFGDIKQNEFLAATFATRGNQAEQLLSELDQEGFNPASLGVGAQTFFLPERVKSSNLKKYEQAASNFITAVLRKESGAAIAKDEFEREYQKYFAQPGDSSDILQQKAQARQIALAGLRAEGQRALPYVTGQLQAAQPAAPVQRQASRITPALQAQAQAQMQAATQALQKNPNDAVAKQVLERAKLILGQ
jgi:hypothetical protein